MTPPSVRFVGRKVYLGAVAVLISAMRQGRAPRRVRELSTRFGADGATIARWQAFWRDHIPQTPFWKVARARLIPLFDVALLPLSLLDAFLRTKDRREPLRFLENGRLRERDSLRSKCSSTRAVTGSPTNPPTAAPVNYRKVCSQIEAGQN